MKWREKIKLKKEKGKVVLTMNLKVYFKEQEVKQKKAKNKIDSE